MKPVCLHRFASLGSTNDEAMRLLRGGAPEGTVVWSERQTAGRGRMGRSWETEAGNLSMSVIARPALSAALAGRIGVSCGLAIAQALGTLSGRPIRTKWPNDLYLHGRKVGGLLIETRLRSGGVIDGAVVGVGVNVATHPDIPPPGHPATSLRAHHCSVSVDALVAPVALAALTACRTAATDDWANTLSAAWWAMDLAAGPVRVRDGDAEYDAMGEGLADDGALIVRRGGSVQHVRAVDVSVRSSAH
jgi:BirA family biotin operon repressor/biotin-[acetyl-CoA-carboxylase] ligase